MAILALVSAVQTTNAGLIEYNFDYTFLSNEVLSGTLQGELQADGDTILVDSISMAFFTGAPTIEFSDDLTTANSRASLSGSTMELVTLPPLFSGGWVLLNNVDRLGPDSAQVGIPFLNILEDETFFTDRWRISGKVSTPSTIMLLSLGLAILVPIKQRLRNR